MLSLLSKDTEPLVVVIASASPSFVMLPFIHPCTRAVMSITMN
jgi:hypothetical protein